LDKNAYLIELSTSERTDFGVRDFADQSELQRVFSAIWTLEAEVNNGGFHQYFLNSAGETANFAPHALGRVGATSTAEIAERALLAVSPEPFPEDQDARQAMLEGLNKETIDQLESLDAEFYAYPDDLTELLFEFVRAHPEEFGPTP
jgi:hypothetical protein